MLETVSLLYLLTCTPCSLIHSFTHSLTHSPRREQLGKRAMLEVTDDVLEMQRLQYAKLLSLERRELDSEKQLSDTWIKYVYLLLESTLSRCAQEGAQFHSLDEVQQTLLLRAQANELRRQCGLAPFDVVYDPLDAAEVVTQLADSPLGLEVGLDKPADVVLEMLNSKYHDTLQSTAVSQLRSLSLYTILFISVWYFIPLVRSGYSVPHAARHLQIVNLRA